VVSINNLNKLFTVHRSDKNYCFHQAQINGKPEAKNGQKCLDFCGFAVNPTGGA